MMNDETMNKMSTVFVVRGEISTAANALKVCANNGVNVKKLSSAKLENGSNEFTLTCDVFTSNCQQAIAQQLKQLTQDEVVVTSPGTDSDPWFPMKIEDLDKIKQDGFELSPSHPGSKDAAYCDRRRHFTEIASNYKHGEEIPSVEYTGDEMKTWRMIYKEMSALHPTHACREFNRGFSLLREHCGLGEDRVPQLEEVSAFLQKRTGFRLRPVAGLISARDFLAGLAFRVFYATQYLRHSSQPFYAAEPDVCREMIGHVALLTDESFAQFSHQVGLASLGASDEWIEKLSACFWFTFEFGICKEEGKLKAYGAVLLSSPGELQYCLSGDAEIREFQPGTAGMQKYPIGEYQPVYFAIDNFAAARSQIQEVGERQIERKFAVSFDPYTNSVQLIDDKEKLLNLFERLSDEMSVVREAIFRLF